MVGGRNLAGPTDDVTTNLNPAVIAATFRKRKTTKGPLSKVASGRNSCMTFKLTKKNVSEEDMSDTAAPNQEEEEAAPQPEPKVEDPPAPTEAPPEPAEVWDLTRVLDAQQQGTDKKTICMADACGKNAVAAWKSNLDPDNEWLCCESCQQQDFGGRPDNIRCPLQPATEAAPPTTNESKPVEATPPSDETTPTTPPAGTAATSDPSIPTDEPVAPAEAPVEKQDIVMSDNVVPSEENTKPIDPTTTNKDSTEKELPTVADVAQPENVVPIAPEPENVAPIAPEPEAPTEEVWELQKVMTVEDLQNDKPIKCNTEACQLVAACVYVSNMDPANPWHSCLDCQKLDYGGWPDVSEMPIKEMSQEHKDLLAKCCSSTPDVAMPDFSTPEPEESWDLKKVIPIKDLTECPIKCSTETCKLLAACVYISNLAPTTKWYSCLDCQVRINFHVVNGKYLITIFQEADYGGWPDPQEMPIKGLTAEHAQALVTKCSKRKDVPMPQFAPPTTSVTSPTKTIQNSSNTMFTPEPNQAGKATVTPSPAMGGNKPKAKAKPSKQLLELHRKWQEAAEKAGGPGVRIVVNKPEAKKLIFDLLYDKFRPMNITQINMALKSIVPPPVLKACLDDMALDPFNSDEVFADSDDEDGATSKKMATKKAVSSPDSYASSLCIKAGRSAGGSLYYVDHTKCANNGNGLPRDERDELYAAFHKTKADIDAMKESATKMKAETATLLSQPTNAEAAASLEQEEANLANLTEKVEAARKLKVNEKHKQQLKKRIRDMAGFWRKRRRMCLDFLLTMEESTEGTISMKKCLKGDGQIEIESDESVLKMAKEAATNKKRAFPGRGKRPAKKAKVSKSAGLPPSDDFIGVTLNSQGMVERILLDED